LEGPEVEALVIDCLLSMAVTGTSPVMIPSMGVAMGARGTHRQIPAYGVGRGGGLARAYPNKKFHDISGYIRPLHNTMYCKSFYLLTFIALMAE